MFKRIAEAIRTSYNQETLKERSTRMVPGAIFGTFAATVFVVTSSIINVIFFPDLHLGVEWLGLVIRWIEFGLALSIAGMIVGWFTEDYMGIVGGGIILTILVLVGNLVSSIMGNGNASLTFQSFITTLPLIGVGVLLAWAIRVAINRHLHIKQQETRDVRRKLYVQLIAIIFLVGLIPGIFSRFGLSSEMTLRTVNNSLQNAATDPLSEYRFPFSEVPALKNHLGMNYTLFAHASAYEAGSLDITIRFEDGYTITCIVPTSIGEALTIQVCNEGTKITNP